uniref:Ectonucleotide pyrophosphatase/phosphodiesterase family member 3 n=1 Tax=Anthurium amnicola TaxID=1678845 RepID=A0A1D1YHB4_9ARAE
MSAITGSPSVEFGGLDERERERVEIMGSAAMSILSPSAMATSHTEEDPPNPTTSLLSNTSYSPSRRWPACALFASLGVTTCVAVAAAFAFAYLFFSSPHPPPAVTTAAVASLSDPDDGSPRPAARPLAKLPHPVVLLVSLDGFRFGYQYKAAAPNIRRLVANGTEAEEGLIPVFPTLTFPNHYSIVTGLYPHSHGIVNNYFVDPADGDVFNMASHEPKWWLGEPLWETAANQGLKAATFFWPGSEVPKGAWTCPPRLCQHYDGSVPFDRRVDTILGYFDLPGGEVPAFITLYFEDPDHQGHQVGPDAPQITDAVARMDLVLGRLISGLEKRGVFEDVTIMLLGDHGMVGNCDTKMIYLDDLAPWIQIPRNWVQSHSPVIGIRPPPGVSNSDVVAKMNEGLASGKVENGKYLQMYLKEDLPGRLHYSGSDRIPPIIGMLAEGFKVELKRSKKKKECGGSHGYDNAFFSMRTIFVAHGPQFEKGRKVPSFENVQIYNLVTTILNLRGALNNGSSSLPPSILLQNA